MTHRDFARAIFALTLGGCLTLPAPSAAADQGGDDVEALATELRATETAFARTMADRSLAEFETFLAEDTVFFAGDRPLRGRAAVVAAWQPFFEGPEAPFSWQPEVVVVLDSKSLGLTSGPVVHGNGDRIGTFNSVWRREPDGRWRIVFDRGCPPCAGP